MSRKCKARDEVLADLDFIHSLTHNLKEYTEQEDWPVKTWKAKSKMLKEFKNAISNFLSDVDECEENLPPSEKK